MPIALDFNPDSGILVGTGSGTLTLLEAKAGVAEFLSHPDWNTAPIVWDLRAAQLEFSLMDVRAFAAFVTERRPPHPRARVAIVASRDVDFGLARMFEAFREDAATEVHVFRDLDQAITWARSALPSA